MLKHTKYTNAHIYYVTIQFNTVLFSIISFITINLQLLKFLYTSAILELNNNIETINITNPDIKYNYLNLDICNLYVGEIRFKKLTKRIINVKIITYLLTLKYMDCIKNQI
jgi:hypothetical protein